MIYDGWFRTRDGITYPPVRYDTPSAFVAARRSLKNTTVGEVMRAALGPLYAPRVAIVGHAAPPAMDYVGWAGCRRSLSSDTVIPASMRS